MLVPMSEHTTQISQTPRLERSRTDRMVAGVAGGLGRYFEIHPVFFRVGFVVLTLLGGAGILIYAAAAIVIPDHGQEDSIATRTLRQRRDRPWPLIGLGLLAVGGAVVLADASLWPEGDAWLFLALAGGAILWITRHTTPAQEPDDASSADVAALAAQDSRRMRRLVRGFLITIASFIALVVVAVAVFAAVFHVHLGRGVGERTYAPSTLAELRSRYELGIGDLRLDLTQIRFPLGETTLDVRVDVGEIVVVVPEDVAVRAHGRAKAGRVELLGAVADGYKADYETRETGARVLVVDAATGAGSVRVERAVR